MKVETVARALEKHGQLRFESNEERRGFIKIAQGAIDPMMAQMMAQQAGMPPMADPSMIDPQMAAMQGMPMDPNMQGMPAGMPMDPNMQGMPPMADPMAQSMGDTPSSDDTLIGESISNKDIESLVKVINLLTSMKSRYDSMKKEQMAALQDSALMANGGELGQM